MAAALACRLRWMSGRATLTTKKSRMKTNVPVRMTASGTHLAMRGTEPASVSRCWLVIVIPAASGLPYPARVPATSRNSVTGSWAVASVTGIVVSGLNQVTMVEVW
jgi:hypothetical protein